MNNKELAMKLAEFLDEKKAIDIKVIDISEKSSFADYFINASVGSMRHLDSLSNDVEESLLKNNIEIKGKEGKPDSGWILVDAGDIIVNLFTMDVRDKYTLDKIWNDCETFIIENR